MLAIRAGLLGGFLLIAYLSVLYFVDKSLLVRGWEKLAWLGMLFFLFGTAWLRRNQEPEGFIGFRPLLQTTYRSFVLAHLSKFAFIYILFRYIDPELTQMAKMAELQLLWDYRNPEVPDAIFKENLDRYASGDFGPRILDLGLAAELVLGFVFAAIISGILRRDAPYYNQPDDRHA